MPDPETGLLLTVPSYSPENSFLYEGERCSMTVGSAFDTAVAKRSFQIVRCAAQILGREDSFTRSLKELLEKLPPIQVGSKGQLLEWVSEYEEAKISLALRLGENAQDIVYANWAGALLILYYARLLDGEKAGGFVKPMIAFLSRENMMITHQGPTTSVTGGIYELDGNTGFTAGVAEMLVQSGSDGIRILPAVPESWRTGAYRGLRVSGGHEVCAQWDEKNVSGSVLAAKSGELRVACMGQEQVFSVKKGERCRFLFERRNAALRL